MIKKEIVRIIFAATVYDYLNSLKLILNLSPKKIYPGHGPIVDNPHEVLQYYISHRQQRNEQILAALKQSNNGLDPNEITKIVYGNINKLFFFIEKIVNLILKKYIQNILDQLLNSVLY